MKEFKFLATGSTTAWDLVNYVSDSLEYLRIPYTLEVEEQIGGDAAVIRVSFSDRDSAGKNGERLKGERSSQEKENVYADALMVCCLRFEREKGAQTLRDGFEGPFDYVIVEISSSVDGVIQIGLENFLKESGSKKVLFWSDQKEKICAFEKVFDRVLRGIFTESEVAIMPEDIPEQLVDRLRNEAVDRKLTCTRAHEIARELGLPVRVVGRACDILGIKIVECELGCF